jgi:hypothetical protein
MGKRLRVWGAPDAKPGSEWRLSGEEVAELKVLGLDEWATEHVLKVKRETAHYSSWMKWKYWAQDVRRVLLEHRADYGGDIRAGLLRRRQAADGG